jgi:hypothetical protein
VTEDFQGANYRRQVEIGSMSADKHRKIAKYFEIEEISFDSFIRFNFLFKEFIQVRIAVNHTNIRWFLAP